MKAFANMKARYAGYKELDSKDKRRFWGETLLNNAIYILIIIAAIYDIGVKTINNLAPFSIVP